MQGDLIRRFHAALPEVRQWIDELLDEHRGRARAVNSLGCERLPACFPPELLERAKAVTLPRVPFPPIDRFGLPELAPVQQMSFAGITFKDTCFLLEDRASESLYFHELVHVVQWARLGVDNFLLAYGIGLIQFGYNQSPLEQLAYTLERSFEDGSPPKDLVRFIETRTDDIWAGVAPIIQAGDRNA